MEVTSLEYIFILAHRHCLPGNRTGLQQSSKGGGFFDTYCCLPVGGFGITIVISHIIDITMGFLRMWTGSDSLKVSSQQERKSKHISHNVKLFL